MEMMDQFLKYHKEFRFDQFKDELSKMMEKIKKEYERPHITELEDIISRFPDIEPSKILLDTDKVTIGDRSDVSDQQYKEIGELLLDINP